MSKQESKQHVTTGSFRLLSRNLARELTDAELNAVSGGTTSRTRYAAAEASLSNIIVVDDADA
ncbi:bacteriocin [Xanthomonas campestris]|uniref:bacteriocin n=1 Tax=Xanthomonas campestris TaxID=339 RepID=UPI003CEEB7BC